MGWVFYRQKKDSLGTSWGCWVWTAGSHHHEVVGGLDFSLETVSASPTTASCGPAQQRKSEQGSAFWAPCAGSRESRCFPRRTIGPGEGGLESGTLLPSVCCSWKTCPGGPPGCAGVAEPTCSRSRPSAAPLTPFSPWSLMCAGNAVCRDKRGPARAQGSLDTARLCWGPLRIASGKRRGPFGVSSCFCLFS